MDAAILRKRAANALRLAHDLGDDPAAARLKLMAADLLAEADRFGGPATQQQQQIQPGEKERLGRVV
jgi:hypothetical protein